MRRRAARPLSLAVVVLACSACTFLTGVPEGQPLDCEPEMQPVAHRAEQAADSLPTAQAGVCADNAPWWMTRD